MRERSIPPDAYDATDAIEGFRGWLIDDKLQCSLLPTIWKGEPEWWGLLLADVAHQSADAVADTTTTPRPVIMAKIVKALLKELSQSTGEHTGNFVE